jgi:hypothetical protein
VCICVSSCSPPRHWVGRSAGGGDGDGGVVVLVWKGRALCDGVAIRCRG